MLISETQLRAERAKQIHLVAQAIWMMAIKLDNKLTTTQRLERSEDAINTKLLEPQRGATRH